MLQSASQSQVFHILKGEAREVKHTPFGSVGALFNGEGIEAVWISKKGETIDPGWFSQPMVDLILVVAGRLRIEYEDAVTAPVVLAPGDLLVLSKHAMPRLPLAAREP